MKNYSYIIIGGGMTGASAMKAIRSADPSGSIAMFSTEKNPPYARPPLTKGLWLGRPLEKIWRSTDYDNTNIFLNKAVIRLNTDQKQIEDDQGVQYGYEKLLLATGGNPRRLKFGEDSIIYYRTLEDYYQVRQLSSQASHFGILGGGFIGCELAAALCQQGNKVTQVVPEDGLSTRVFPADLSQWLTEYYRNKGIEVFTQESVENVEKTASGLKLVTSKHPDLPVDAVIAGIGIIPAVALAESAGIDVDNGILVNEYLETSAPAVYAAGDVAAFFNPYLGNRLRVEHEDNSVSMGWTAGINMTGKTEKYDHLPFFYSDMFELGYEAVGDLNPSLQVTAYWVEPYKKGVLFYQNEDMVRGILLWNVWKKVDAAREIIQAGLPISPSKLKGMLTG